MDYAAVETFLSRLPIRDLRSHARVPFKFKYNQKKLHQHAADMQARGKPVRIVVNKARRVTCSSWATAVLFCHNLWLPSSHSLVVAHEFKTSKELMQTPRTFLEAVPWLGIDAVEREIRFPHQGAPSIMQIITAGKDTSGRGFTLSGLLASEAAHYISPDSFVSMLPALSTGKDTIGIIESTPNGRDGQGEMFYDMYWAAVRGDSEWEAEFLTWVDDPDCRADESFASDAPADEEEKDLMQRGLNKSQLAWRRLKIASPECGGAISVFHQEYATTAEESFIASGYPAFEIEEIKWARANLKEPKWRGFIEQSQDGTLKRKQHSEGTLLIWENPIHGHYYYIGLDAARGEEGRDFTAMCGWDGTTGHQVFSFNDYCTPEVVGFHANSLGRWYNRAMVNGDLTGGYGSGALYTMRETCRYPLLYRYKGKDDKMGGTVQSKALWTDIGSYIRSQMFEYFRIALREGSATDGDFGVTVYDQQLASQIELCSRKDSGRIDVRKGHDDLLFATLLGYLAMKHWAPPRSPNRAKDKDSEMEAEALAKMNARGDVVLDDAKTALQRHYAKIIRSIERGTFSAENMMEVD